MTRADIPSRWLSTQQFAIISTPRRRKLSGRYEGSTDDRLVGVDYVEIDARGVKGAIIYYAFNGRTASSSLATGADEVNQAIFRLPPDSIDRLFVHATSVSVVSTVNATTIYISTARF